MVAALSRINAFADVQADGDRCSRRHVLHQSVHSTTTRSSLRASRDTLDSNLVGHLAELLVESALRYRIDSGRVAGLCRQPSQESGRTKLREPVGNLARSKRYQRAYGPCHLHYSNNGRSKAPHVRGQEVEVVCCIRSWCGVSLQSSTEYYGCLLMMFQRCVCQPGETHIPGLQSEEPDEHRPHACHASSVRIPDVRRVCLFIDIDC